MPCAPIMAMDEVFASPDGAGLIQQVDDPVAGVAPTGREPDPVRRHGAGDAHAAAIARRTRRGGAARTRGRSVTAADRWRERLAEWAIPDEIVANAPESPWGFATECFRRRGEAAPAPEPTPTTRRALEALPAGGTVLDVGVGGGATSLPLAGRAGSIVGVDQQPDMLEGFLANAATAGVEARAVTGRGQTLPRTSSRPTSSSRGTSSTTSRSSSRSRAHSTRTPAAASSSSSPSGIRSTGCATCGSGSTTSNGPTGRRRTTPPRCSPIWVSGWVVMNG